MPKKNVNKPQREVTKRQLSRWKKESRLQRVIMLGGIIIIVAVLIIVGTGLYFNQYKPLREVVIKVGDTEYNMDYYIDMLAYYGLMQGWDYIPYMVDDIAAGIQHRKLVVDAAANLDPPITVSDDEVNKEIKEKGLRATAARKDIIRMELLANKLKTEYFDNQVPPTAEHRAVLAMFLESRSQADEIILRLNKGEKFQDIAAELSLEESSQEKGGDFGWIPEGVLSITLGNTVLSEKAFSGDIKLNEPVLVADPDRTKTGGYWLLKVTETREEDDELEFYLYAMLLESREKAEELKAELDGGADFVELAKANSQYWNAAEDGGDLGFVWEGRMSKAIDEVLFPEDEEKPLEIGLVSDPIRDEIYSTRGGSWLLMVTGIDGAKPIEVDHRNALSAEQLNNWFDKVWEDNYDQLQTLLSDAQKWYAVEKAFAR